MAPSSEEVSYAKVPFRRGHTADKRWYVLLHDVGPLRVPFFDFTPSLLHPSAVCVRRFPHGALFGNVTEAISDMIGPYESLFVVAWSR